MAISARELDLRFAPPAPGPEHIALKAQVSAAAHQLGDLIRQLVPGSREQSIAIEHLEEVVHWAHAGIDRRHTPTRRGATVARQRQP